MIDLLLSAYEMLWKSYKRLSQAYIIYQIFEGFSEGNLFNLTKTKLSQCVDYMLLSYFRFRENLRNYT